MATIVKEGGGVVSVLLALLVIGLVAFMIYAFSSGNFGGAGPQPNSIKIEAPSVPTPAPGQ